MSATPSGYGERMIKHMGVKCEKLVNLGKRVQGHFMHVSCYFYVNLKLFQNKEFKIVQ